MRDTTVVIGHEKTRTEAGLFVGEGVVLDTTLNHQANSAALRSKSGLVSMYLAVT